MRSLLLGFCVALCMAQSPGNQIYTLSATTGATALISRNIILDPPLTFTKTDTTKYWHLGAKLPGSINFNGGGFIEVTSPDGSRQVFLDTSYVTYRSPVVPSGPGTCEIGTGGWSADSQFAYFCVPNPAADQQGAAPFLWGRVPVQTAW